jgi:hypothetical protein
MRTVPKVAWVIVGLMATLGVLFYLLMPARPDGKLVTVSFGGFTNQAGVRSAVLLVQNRSRRAVKVMDHYYVESPAMATYATSNHIIGAGTRLPTGTNLVVAAGQTHRLRIPVPSGGNRWRVSLELAGANLQTDLAEYLQKPHGSWVKWVPFYVKDFWTVEDTGCEFSTLNSQ